MPAPHGKTVMVPRFTIGMATVPWSPHKFTDWLTVVVFLGRKVRDTSHIVRRGQRRRCVTPKSQDPWDGIKDSMDLEITELEITEPMVMEPGNENQETQL